jgi:hypothetical protein
LIRRPAFESKALFVTRFTLPPIESASMSGVAAFVTSIVSMLPSDACSNSNARPKFADCAVATFTPSIVTEFRSALTPRTLTWRTSGPL